MNKPFVPSSGKRSAPWGAHTRIKVGIKVRAIGIASAALLVLTLSACALPDKPERPTVFDFGPGALQPAAANRMAPLPPIALADPLAAGPLESTNIWYRLAYANARELRPYTQSRWAVPPTLLVRQRLREALGQRRTVVSGNDPAAIGRMGEGRATDPWPMLLRIELDEFSQVFDSPTNSQASLRLHATLTQPGPMGERLVAQRTVQLQRPAPTADATGAVAGLADATDAAVADIVQWLATVR